MALTSAQLAILKADILATPALAAQPMNSDGAFAIAAYYNSLTSPTFVVWKTSVAITAVGQTFNATELANLSSLNTTRLQNLAAWLAEGVNPSVTGVRQFFDDIFSGAGGTSTRAALLALWKRPATRVEKLFATGTGSDASPATLVYEGALSADDVQQARES